MLKNRWSLKAKGGALELEEEQKADQWCKLPSSGGDGQWKVVCSLFEPTRY